MTFVQKTVEHPDYPLKKGTVRMRSYKGIKMWQEDNALRFVDINNFDMGGYFPMKMLSYLYASMARKGLDQMMKDLKKYE